MNYKIEKDKILISLEPSEKINENLEKVALNENIESAWISGIGAITNVEMGFFDPESKEYIKKIFDCEYELTSLTGNISIRDNKQFSHTHITFSDKNFRVYGGHLFDATITAAGEFLILKNHYSLKRKFNKDVGLALWCFDEK